MEQGLKDFIMEARNYRLNNLEDAESEKERNDIRAAVSRMYLVATTDVDVYPLEEHYLQ